MTEIADRIVAQLKKWQRDLVNLNRNNRLLYMRPSSMVEVAEPDAVALYAGLDRGWTIVEPPERATTPAAPPVALRSGEARLVPPARTKLPTRLRTLERTANQVSMDRGLWVLYLAFGVLDWKEAQPGSAESVEVHSPLFLVPAQLVRPTVGQPYVLRRMPDEEERFNPALVLKLEKEYGISLQVPEDDEEVDLEELFESIRAQVARHGWDVRPQVFLSAFSFHKEPILRDLEENEEAVLASQLVQGIAGGRESGVSFEFDGIPDGAIDDAAPPESTVTILDADTSQRKAIAAVVAGHSFVMDGPPGTGKSQTIANMIADLLEKNRKVLFVSEKAAALEVVYKRLEKAGLDEFVLELHSHKATRKEVAKALGASLQKRLLPASRMSDEDLDRLRRRRMELTAYVDALNELRQPLGQSLHRVLGRIAAVQHLPQAPPPHMRAKDLDGARWSELSSAADALGRAWGPVARGDDFFWRDLEPGPWDQSQKVELLRHIDALHGTLAAAVPIAADLSSQWLLEEPRHIEDLFRLADLEDHLRLRNYAFSPWLAVDDLGPTRRRLEAARTSAAEAADLEQRLAAAAGPRWSEIPECGPDPLTRAAERLRALVDSGTNASSLDAPTARALAERLRAGERILHGSAAHVRRLSRVLRIDPAQVSMARATELAQLGLLAAELDRPDGAWLAPQALARARRACTELSERLAPVKLHEEALGSVFTRAITDLDLETLCVRFETVYRSVFSWFRTDFRRDRATVRACSRTGRVDRTVIGRLREALEWQKAIRAFEAAAAEHGPTLGTHYFRGESTDLGRVGTALDLAGRVLELAGPAISQDVLAEQFGAGHDSDSDLLPAAAEQIRTAEQWTQLSSALGPLVDRFTSVPLAAAASALAEIAVALEAVSALLDPLDAIAARPIPIGAALDWLRLRARLAAIDAAFDSSLADDRQVFGPAWMARATDWRALADGLAWCEAACSILGQAFPPAAAERYASVPPDNPRLRAQMSTWATHSEQVLARFAPDRRRSVSRELGGSFAAVARLLRQLAETIDDVGEWYEHVRACERLNAAGLGPAVDFCIARRIPREHVRAVLERAILEAWSDDVLGSDARLETWRAADRDAHVVEFRELDRKLIRLSAAATISACSRRRPANLAGAASIVLRESQKQRRHMRIRDLIAQAYQVVMELKPCFMMSPLAVSQFLPAGLGFDVIIFDEASQVRPADAINCIYRGKQLVVAGDQRQLPPTSFFDRMENDDEDVYDDEQLDDFESVLDVCKASGVFSPIPLRWHYRSQHEHLIAYSNHSFYDGHLVTFPGAVHTAPDLGVEMVRVNGVYRRGAQRDNPVEARAVAERVRHHAEVHPELTIGVVAFSEAQASAVEYEIEKLAADVPALRKMRDADRLTGLFVKNLETVQGDERDIIIFSVGYGPDENGHFTLNFGPLNKAGGERRLNVVVTRARRKVEVVTSIDASSISMEVANPALRHFRRYLDYAARGEDRMAVLSIPASPSVGEIESPFEAEVARVISGLGYTVIPQVGCSDYRIDMGVTHPSEPGRFVLGVECDGAMYHGSRAARDRDRLRQEVLQRLGWRLHRIWGPSWWRNRREQEAALRQAIENSIATTVPAAAPAPPVEAERPPVIEIPFDPSAPPAWAVTYELAEVPSPRQRGIDMHEAAAQADLQHIVSRIVEVEGPVHRDRVLRRARAAWGVGRAGNRIQEAFDVAVRSLGLRTRLKDQRGFLLIDGQADRVRIPNPGEPDTRRTVDEVPPKELELAVVKSTLDARRIERAALLTYIARLYGWERNGDRISHVLELTLSRVEGRGLVTLDEGDVLPGVNGAGSLENRGGY